jgi:hypothetical protein
MKKNLEHMEDKMTSIQEDRNWLENQLKSTKKQNKLLRAELEIRIERANAASGGADLFMSGGLSSKDSSFPTIGGRESPLRTHRSSSTRGKDGARPYRPLTQEAASSPLRESNDAIILQKNKEIKALRASLATERKYVQGLRASIVTSDAHRNDLEELFIKCVEEARLDISKRRGAASGGRPGTRQSSLKEMSDEEMKEALHSISLGDLSIADRRRVMENLCMNEKVLSFIYNNLFGGKSLDLTADTEVTES